MNDSLVLQAAGYENLVDYQYHDVDGLKWLSGKAQPSQKQLDDWRNDLVPLPSGELFSEWFACHGGDPDKTRYRTAKKLLDDADEASATLLRAAIIELLENDNRLVRKYNQMLNWLGSQTSLGDRGQLTGFQGIEGTAADAKQQIKDRIDASEAD